MIARIRLEKKEIEEEGLRILENQLSKIRKEMERLSL